MNLEIIEEAQIVTIPDTDTADALEQMDLTYACEECNVFHLVAPNGWFNADELEAAFAEVKRVIRGEQS